MPKNQLAVLSAEQMLSETPAQGFDCGDCTACCTVLAVTELHKPMRFACQHICRDGCRTYPDRPAGCRQFNCLWLRGALQFHAAIVSTIPGDSPVVTIAELTDELLRPDHSGVIWDYFVEGQDKLPCLVAFEVWTDAFGQPENLEFLRRIADQFALRLSFRDGEWAQVTNRSELDSLLVSRTDA